MFDSEKIKVDGHTLLVTDVRPKNGERETPLFFVPGWSANADMFNDLVQTFVNHGRRVIVTNNFYGIDHDYNHEYPDIVLRNVAVAKKILDVKNLTKVDALAHSSGCLHLALTAKLYPERFRSIILATPAGLIGKDSLLPLVGRFLYDQLIQTWRSFKSDTMKKAVKQTMRVSRQAALESPRQGYREAVAISTMQTKSIIAELQTKNVRVGILHSKGDRAFPAERLVKNIGKELANLVKIVPGTHNELYLDQSNQVKLLEQMFSEMNHT